MKQEILIKGYATNYKLIPMNIPWLYKFERETHGGLYGWGQVGWGIYEGLEGMGH